MADMEKNYDNLIIINVRYYDFLALEFKLTTRLLHGESLVLTSCPNNHTVKFDIIIATAKVETLFCEHAERQKEEDFSLIRRIVAEASGNYSLLPFMR